MKRLLAVLMAVGMLGATFSAVAAAPAWADEPADPKAGCNYHEETGHNLCAGFLQYWEHYGGLAIFGHPITEEYVDEDTGLVTQWFERARFEWHPGEWPERWDVMLGLLGNEYAAHEGLLTSSPFQTSSSLCDDYDWAGGGYDADCVYFPETGHNLSGGFKAYWETYGGLAVFGYPISEEFVEDGLVVQYFERQRFEWHPGEWPERWDVMLGLLGNTLAHVGDEPGPAPEPQPTITVVASELDNPRGLTVTEDGTVYVSESGVAGEDCATIEDPEDPEASFELCFGYTGSITQIANGEQTRVVSDLPSSGTAEGETTGPQDVIVGEDGKLYTIIGLGADPAQRAVLAEQAGEIVNDLGYLIEIENGEWTKLVDVAAYEANNPDEGLIDSNPFSLVQVTNDVFVVSDAGGNALLQVTAEGEIETLAVFPARMVDAPPFIGAPEGTQIPMESVPTGVKIGPDGAYYVGELTGFPFEQGAARVWRVVPGEEPEVYAEGFTNILDIAFDEDGHLLVLEMAQASLLGAEEDPRGALIHVDEDGTQTVLVGEGLILPTGMDVGPDGAIYVSNMGIMPGQGQVVRIDLP